MELNWKQAVGALALSAMTLGVTGGDMALAKGKSATMDPPPPSVDKGKSAVLKPTPPDDVTATEKGIKDNGVKGCGNCGLTGRQAAPPATGDGATPPSTEVEVKGGQILEKPPRPSIERRAHDGPGGTPPSTAKKGGKTGWIFATVAGAAAIAAIVAVSGGNDKPASP